MTSFVVPFGFCVMAAAGDVVRNGLPRDVASVLEIVRTHDTYHACRGIERGRTASEAAELYHAVAQPLHLQHKNVRAMVALSRAGIHLALTEADRVQAAEPELAAKLRGQAKTLAYDLGSNLWPGWQDEGIELSSADLQTGLEAARLNLQLAEELNRPALPRCNAHWLLGAHELARGEAKGAREQFELARKHAEAAGKPEFVAMCRGYAAIAALKAQPSDAEAERELAAVVGALRGMGSDDATFFAGQLESVRKLFAPAAQKP
jgi:hypothetical protein